MAHQVENQGTSPPAPRLIIGRAKELSDIRDSLLDGLAGGEKVTLSREAFRKALETSGLTRLQLAERVKVDPKTINNAENEHWVRDTTANLIALHLKTDLRSLVKLPITKTVVALHSSPGLGKTTVLQAICHENEIRTVLSDGTLWAPLGQSPDIAGILIQWVSSLGLSELEAMRKLGQQCTPDFLRATLNAALSQRRVLILLDDAWSADHVTKLLVGGCGCPVLVTTRHLELARQVSSSSKYTIALKRLTDEDSLELLEILAGRAITENLSDATDLAKALEGHPLGLQVAGRLIATHHATGLDVAALMRKLKHLDSLLNERVADSETPSQTVEAIFKISTDALSETERLCFAFLSSWEAKPAPLDLEMMGESWKPFGVDPEKTAQLLAARGLIEPLGNGKFWIHSLLVAHGRSILKAKRHGG